MEDKVSNDPVVAIVGVTGAVGAEFIATMDKRGFRVGKLKALASARSAGKTVSFRGQDVIIEELTERAFEGVDIALFSAGGSISKKFAPIAVKAGAVVVDNSSAFRMDPNVPLVIPEINANRIRDHKGIIANPNCAAITALVPLWPIHQSNRIKRVIISTYQAASGAGAAAMDELVESTRANLNGQVYTPKVMPHPYAFNLFSHNTAIDPDTGYNDEETKVINETRKIFEDDKIAIGVTCVRVPVLRAHCEAITFECEKPISEDQVRAIMARAPGVKVVDDRARNYFPMPIDASGQDDVLVGRIRKDLSDPSGLSISMFVAADQLLKGAALNAVQIAELLPQRMMA
ncbi:MULTISPECIES: aspartate-semialdehyde dehydrogenase [unclassified Bradyrhizobium]|jgi:aspartate-semialdehyde dehydrogenase|nr:MULTISPECIES: aspartate-semialdehyde dehydrogenase [unclassified Bradyrhizobium]MCK1343401.1 aspartate-semialdehyde dehydrogenase [Bradyrhizobium sp. CW11]MCK1470239.1 aspartate-semialdehyde dehydrogenase [Bradyrhizobium sp. CW10]MCK1485185.1 aspartate-semialdehyde dehydrogenase [Bradyrhizobium sp. 193]MCK1536405.1 aspartate-semialdehyde dehydrogenase [Bradyrhizobium sp. 176]MCK1553245.1 aspartate-semialdehyde dehydrogenase [Bradyrhizobium sp. 177]